VLDAGSFVSWDAPAAEPAGAAPAYRAALARAVQASGADESVLTGCGTLDGTRVALVVSEFGFLGGSVGVASAERVEAAVRRATAERLPLLAAPASGGTRVQEGTLAFVQMIWITAAITAHRQAALPYIVYLRHPTMGGVLASWGSLGHVTVAEPGALLGFTGPKVHAALGQAVLPESAQTAENLARNGVIDAVVAPGQLRELVARVLRVTTGAPRPAPASSGREPPPGVPAWEAVQRTRAPGRPGLRALLRDCASDLVPLAGTAEGAQPGLVASLAILSGVPCVVVGQDRHAQRQQGPLGPAALRLARRCIRLAGELGLPLVTFIDTPGLSLSRSAEEGGLSAEIARCLTQLLAVRSPTVAVLLGEGAGGGALALLPADRVVAAADAWLAPLPPEGSSAILHQGDTSFAAELAGAQGVTADRLASHGVIDVIVPAPGDDIAGFARALAAAVAREVEVARRVPPARRLAARAERFHVAAGQV
jgi:acetyl-CoA carboxylase carboxyl transferase subunit beta